MIGRQNGPEVLFHYTCACADCDEEGELGIIASQRGTIACPGGCGAVYYPWKGPDLKWRLRCVVLPSYGPEVELPLEAESE